MNRFVALRLLLTASAFVAGATGVALMDPTASNAVHLFAAGLIGFALVLVPLAYQPRPWTSASLAASLTSFALGLGALTPAAAEVIGSGVSSIVGLLAIVIATAQLACLRGSESTSAEIAA